jgi:FMN phosphatase YigB (HAD superfamily)
MSLKEEKLYIFDLDDVLIHNKNNIPILVNCVVKILQKLKDNSIKIALASHNYSAKEILEKLKIIQYFDFIVAYYDYTDKMSHLRKILDYFKINPTQVWFFDDLHENIVSANKLKINAKLIYYETGITEENIIETKEDFFK